MLIESIHGLVVVVVVLIRLIDLIRIVRTIHIEIVIKAALSMRLTRMRVREIHVGFFQIGLGRRRVLRNGGRAACIAIAVARRRHRRRRRQIRVENGIVAQETIRRGYVEIVQRGDAIFPKALRFVFAATRIIFVEFFHSIRAGTVVVLIWMILMRVCWMLMLVMILVMMTMMMMMMMMSVDVVVIVVWVVV